MRNWILIATLAMTWFVAGCSSECDALSASCSKCTGSQKTDCDNTLMICRAQIGVPGVSGSSSGDCCKTFLGDYTGCK